MWYVEDVSDSGARDEAMLTMSHHSVIWCVMAGPEFA